jgi:hypothetical protein
LYFQDDLGNTLAFVRNLSCPFNQEIRVFTDPTLSFELLAVKLVSRTANADQFTVTDCLVKKLAGTIWQRHPQKGFRQEWSLNSPTAHETGAIQEDSLFRALVRRHLTELVPQSYTFYAGGSARGTATPGSVLWAHTTEIDLTQDHERLIDRRLVLAAIVLITAGKRQSDRD